ncbi:hypothetical protein C8R46DRAFT_1094262 [Mycena filopes]|nr:hypothetical protein C8R46DRAFT_1094262 [Mycena filopes]
MSEGAIYVKMLLTQHRGFPLAKPLLSLNQPEEQLQRGICVGDVGYLMDDGTFDFLFNVYLPADHPINGGEDVLPRGFTPLESPQELVRYRYPPNSHVAVGFEKITSSLPVFTDAISFRSTAVAGAICGLPLGSTVEKLSNLESDAARRYVISRAENWYRHGIVHRGRRILNGSLYFVTGTEKTAAWGKATYLQLTHGSTCMHLLPTDQPNQYYWQHSPASATTETSASDHINYCLFLHGFKIGLGDRTWSNVTGQSRTSLPKHDQNLSWITRLFAWIPNPLLSLLWRWPSWFANSYFEPFLTPYSNPSIILSKYVLGREPWADSVVIHDDDWAALIREDETELPDAAEMIRRAELKFNTVKEKGGVYFTPR